METDFEKLELIKLPQESGEWRYHIPNGYTAEIADGFIVIRPTEGEDERIRKWIYAYMMACPNDTFEFYAGVGKGRVLEWLEKQKENPKSADSILSDCVSDVKYEDRWHKVGDSLPDNPREVLCKDEAGNYFIGRYYVGEGWEISNYDDEDKPHHLNPPVSKWIDFPSEKQKEQKVDIDKLRRDLYQSGYNDGYQHGKEDAQKEQEPPIAGNDFGWIDELKHDLEHPEELDQKVDNVLKQRKGIRSLEWSEEDEEMLCIIINRIEKFNEWATEQGFPIDDPTMKQSPIAWLKDLPERFNLQPKHEWSKEDLQHRSWILECLADGKKKMPEYAEDFRAAYKWFKSLRPSWKPSEEDLKDLLRLKDSMPDNDWGNQMEGFLEDLIGNLKKLM